MRIFLLLFFLIIVVCTQAQTSVYHPFPDSNATWCCRLYDYECPYSISSCNGLWCRPFQDTYKLDGYAQINGITYSRMLHRGTSAIYQCNGQFCFCGSFWSSGEDTTTYFIRQDTLSRRVYIYEPTLRTDTILYDFNLHIGDTLDRTKVYWPSGGNDCSVVTSIDSILLDGQYRKRFNYSINSCCPWNNDSSSIVEGVGSMSGLMYMPSNCFAVAVNDGSWQATLNEFIQNNRIVIGDSISATNDCLSIITSVRESSMNYQISVIPNPFTSFASLNIPEVFKHSNLKIYNSFGVLVLEEKINGTTIINRNSLPNGIYFYQLIGNNGQLASGKFVIE